VRLRALPIIVAITFLVTAVLAAVMAAVGFHILPENAGASLLEPAASFIRERVGWLMFGPNGSLVVIAVFLLVGSIVILAVRKRMVHWWWLLPYLTGMYATVLLYSRFYTHRNLDPTTIKPAFLAELAATPNLTLVHVLFGLCLLLEIVLLILFSYVAIHRRKLYLKKLRREQAKAKRDQAIQEQEPVADEPAVPPQEGAAQEPLKEVPEPTKREIRAARRQRKALLKQERTRREAEQRETAEEAVVTVPRQPETLDDTATAMVDPRTDSSRYIDPDAPLVFPKIPEMAPLVTIGRKNHSSKDVQSPEPEEVDAHTALPEQSPQSSVSSDASGNKVFVGSVRIMADSVVLTETPVEEDEKPDDTPLKSNAKRTPYDALESLRKRLAEDAVTDRVTVPSALPHIKKEEAEVVLAQDRQSAPGTQPGVENQDMPQECSKTAAQAVPVSTEIPQPELEVEDDLELAAGIAGLVSSNAGLNALLSRSKLSYDFPPSDLLVEYPDHSTEIDEATRKAGDSLIDTLSQFRVDASLANIVKGPTVTMYEVSPAPGVRVSSITSLADNIALRLAAMQIRIVAPIPGKQAVGIEVPNKSRSIIGFREMIPTIDTKPFNIPMVLGRTITGDPVVIDLTQTPHLLIAGATGSGKSVCVNSLIASILYRKSPRDVRMILVDPKIVELQIYNGIPHLLTPVITEAKKTIKALEFCQYEMQRRYKLLNALAVRNLTAYNKKIQELKLAREKLPYIVVVIDEFADLMVSVGKELETLLGRLAAMSRAVGIHLVLATQRPSANVITGIIKSNIPARIAFMVAGQIDSRIIIDEVGAEKLLGKGDMLFVSSWNPNSIRIQGAFLSDDEVEKLVAFAKSQGEPDYLDEAFFEDEEVEESDEDDEGELAGDSDEALKEKALKIVIERNGASASYLQRRLKIGYNRAARLVEQMEEDGYVGPARGSKPRELLRYPE